ncbi:hypothetical protein [Clostridium sp. UBA3061]|uniref:hypothetical protein n=1 Tax=Clostridium sp. UBA3061 TaxID=1946353 RepID=UPI003217D2B5
MKKIIIGILALCIIGAIAVAIYVSHTKTNISIYKETTNPIQNDNNQYTEEEVKRVKLYVAVMSAAFQIENGGNGFIAVQKDTLDGLIEEKAKEDVKDDKSLFEFDDNGMMSRTLNGTMLSIKVAQFKNNKAVVESTSWFGNLGAVFPKYKAVYKNGQWELEVISMAIS